MRLRRAAGACTSHSKSDPSDRAVNLNQVTLPSHDVSESVRFYERMGFAVIVRSPHYARFACPEGESTFSVHSSEGRGGGGGVVIYFECADLDAKVSSLRAAGFSFSQLPADQPWLWREARLSDPFGNEICLFWAGQNRKNPPWRVSGLAA